MPHSKFKVIYPFIDAGTGKCPCGRTFDYESERDRKTKVRLHKKFCDKWPSDASFTKTPRKAMTAKEFQRFCTERREFRD